MVILREAQLSARPWGVSGAFCSELILRTSCGSKGICSIAARGELQPDVGVDSCARYDQHAGCGTSVVRGPKKQRRPGEDRFCLDLLACGSPSRRSSPA